DAPRGPFGKRVPVPAALAPAELVEALLHRLELRRGRPGDVARQVEALAPGLDLRDDLRDASLLVCRQERQARGDLGDAGERAHLARGRLLERQLRAREEEVVDEVRARLPE